MVTETQNYASPDYGSVPNIRLREFLIDYEEIIRENPEPIKATGYHFEGFASCGIQLKSRAVRIACELRGLEIIKANPHKEKGDGGTYQLLKFGIWERRAIAAFCWTYLKKPLDKTSLAEDFPQRINTLREALGSHPLTSYIHDPKENNFVPTAKSDSGIITFKDESTASISDLSALLQGRRSDEIINPAEFGLTDAQLETIIQLATGVKRSIDVTTISVERLGACLDTLPRS